MRIFDRSELEVITEAAQEADLVEVGKLGVLVRCLPPSLQRQIPADGAPAIVLENLLRACNDTRLARPHEESPMGELLAVMARMAEPRLPAGLLSDLRRRATRRCRPRGVADLARRRALDQTLTEAAAAADERRLALFLGHWLLRPHYWLGVCAELRFELRYRGQEVEDLARLSNLYLDERAIAAGSNRARGRAALLARLRAALPRFDDSAHLEELGRALDRAGVSRAYLGPVDEASFERLAGAFSGELVPLFGLIEADDVVITEVDFDDLGRADDPGRSALLADLRGGAVLFSLGFSSAELAQVALLTELPRLAGRGLRAALLVGEAGRDDEASAVIGFDEARIPVPWTSAAAGWRWWLASLGAQRSGSPAPALPRSGPEPLADVESTRAGTRRRLAAEGLSSPEAWFVRWQPDRPLTALPPPRHARLATVFVDRRLDADRVLRVWLKDRLGDGAAVGLTGLVGLGGVGKTYLAMRVADEMYREGWQIIWVNLLDHGVEEAVDQLVTAFGLGFVGGLTLEEKLLAVEFLVDQLGTRRALVVLDNAERFPDLRSLLKPILRLPVLVTSRMRDCADIISYRRLDTLSEAEVQSLCAQFLDAFDQGRYGELSDDDLHDLAALGSDLLGGHPLGIQMALSGYVARVDLQRQVRPFRRLIQELRGGPVDKLRDANVGLVPKTGEELHETIRSTFDWLFVDLPAIALDEAVGRRAQLLLPVLAVLGHEPVSPALLGAAVELLASRCAPAAGRLAWVADLQALREANAQGAAIDALIRITLLEPAGAKGDAPAALRIHPLVREFALALRGDDEPSPAAEESGQPIPLGATGPLPDLLFEVAIEVFGGDARQGGGMMDLLKRLGSRIPLIRQALRRLRQPRWSPHRHGDFGGYIELLRQAHAVAKAAGMDADAAMVAVELGEVLCRAEYGAEGVACIRAALSALSPDDKDQHRQLSWGRAWLAHATPVDDVGPWLRRVFRAWLRVVEEAPINAGAYQNLQRRLQSLHRPWRAIDCYVDAASDLPGICVTLGWLLAEAARRGPQPDLVERLEALPAELVDQAGMELGLTYLARRLLARDWCQPTAEAELVARFGELGRRQRAAGLRGFTLTALLHQHLWALAMRRGQWAEARAHASRWEEAATVDDVVYADVATLGGLLAELLEHPERGPRAFGRWAPLHQRLQQRGAVGTLGWSLLAKAAASMSDPAAAMTLVDQARQVFERDLRLVPPHAATVVAALSEAPVPDAPPASGDPPLPDWQPWLIHEVPRRVRDDAGRVMWGCQRGVQPQPGSLGSGWLPPWYVDADPLTFTEFQRFAAATGLRPLDLGPGGRYVTGVPPEIAQRYAAWAGRRLPTLLFWEATRWQASGNTPAVSDTWEEAVDRVLGPIERRLQSAPAPVAVPAAGTGSEVAVPAEPVGRPDVSSDTPDRRWVAAHCAGAWLTGDEELVAAIETYREGISAEGFPSSARDRLLTGLLTSISLSADETEKILENLPKLKLTQLEELNRIFGEEREKWRVLSDRHQPQLGALCRERQLSVAGLLAPGRLPVWTRDVVLRVWSGHTRQDALMGAALPADPTGEVPMSVDEKPVRPHEIGVRCMKVVFFAGDYEGFTAVEEGGDTGPGPRGT